MCKLHTCTILIEMKYAIFRHHKLVSIMANRLLFVFLQAVFDPEIFFYVLLPPIIFYAGYDMKKVMISILL